MNMSQVNKYLQVIPIYSKNLKKMNHCCYILLQNLLIFATFMNGQMKKKNNFKIFQNLGLMKPIGIPLQLSELHTLQLLFFVYEFLDVIYELKFQYILFTTPNVRLQVVDDSKYYPFDIT